MTRSRNLGLLAIAAAIGFGACTAPSAEVAASTRGVASTEPSVAPPPQPGVLAAALSQMPLSADEAWAMLIPGDPGSVSYRSLTAIAVDSDAVVIAAPGDLVKGPDFPDEYGNVIHLATLTLTVDRVIRGTVKTRQPGTLALRFWLGVGDAGGYDYGDVFTRLAASKPSGRAIFYLANTAALNARMGGPPDQWQADPYAYQVLGGQGYLRDVDGLIVPPRVPEEALSRMAGSWQIELSGRPFDEVVASLDAIAKSKP